MENLFKKQYSSQSECSSLRRWFYHWLLHLHVSNFLSAVYCTCYKLFEHFFFFSACFFSFFFSFSMRYVLVNTSYSWRLFSFGYIPPLPTTPLFPNYYSTAVSGPLASSILTKMLGMLPSVSNWGCLLLLLCLLVLLPLHVIWSIRTDFCIFNVLLMKKKLLGLRRAQKCMLPWGSTVLASLTRLTPSQLNYVD